jgi:hypothetical protein
MKNLLAIGLIWLGCALAWVILGSTLLVRSGEMSSALTDEVHRLWGPPLQQPPPRVLYVEMQKRKELVTTHDAAGRPSTHEVEKQVSVEVDVPLQSTDASARLSLEHRRKGLLWFPTYGVQFQAAYGVQNTTAEQRDLTVRFPLATSAGLEPAYPMRESAGPGTTIFDDFVVLDAHGKALPATIDQGVASFTQVVAPGARADFSVRYRSRGTSRWFYHPSSGTGQVHNLRMQVHTDFAAVDFPAGTLSPSSHAQVQGGWQGEWSFGSLVAGAPIGLELPRRLNPGPLASRMTFFAPIGLLFYFFVVAIFAAARAVRFHPLNYFFFGCGFFAFHLLFAYLVDHLSIAPSFVVAALVSTLLVCTYARLLVGWRFALLHMGLSQLVYLVLFSLTFLWEGFTGLAITVGAIVTLFVMMQLTGRASWSAAPQTS